MQTPAKKIFSSIRVYLVKDSETLKATASCLIHGCFYVTQMKVVQGKNGLFLSMPSRKDPQGQYHDLAFPANKDVRDELQRTILEEFEKKVHAVAEPEAVAA